MDKEASKKAPPDRTVLREGKRASQSPARCLASCLSPGATRVAYSEAAHDRPDQGPGRWEILQPEAGGGASGGGRGGQLQGLAGGATLLTARMSEDS